MIRSCSGVKLEFAGGGVGLMPEVTDGAAGAVLLARGGVGAAGGTAGLVDLEGLTGAVERLEGRPLVDTAAVGGLR